MVIYDDVVNWADTGQASVNQNNWENSCRIRIVKLDNTGGVTFMKKYYIVATDLGSDTGTSLTNNAQILIPLVCATHNIDFHEMLWFEHYPHDDSKSEPTLEVVIPKLMQSCCPSACSKRVSVQWRPARINEIAHLKQFIDLKS